ncbi:hypothetical protein ACFKHW_38160 [Bradyrhizobium lupini]|uniref:hypothetical protein n=1 Tax=Rhizobium lupini TaxID=136996 RepID=UPI00366A7AFE
MRRTFTTTAEALDISGYALKALVNHRLSHQYSDPDVTGGYIGLSTERLRDAAQKVANRMRELCGIEQPEGANVTPMMG